jgi:hypothetical protein
VGLFKPSYDVRAKVRIGVKKQTAGGKEFPASVDYFVCDDAEFTRLFAAKPKVIRIRFPFDRALDNFTTGLEWWRGKQLTCYTKDDGTVPPVAFRNKDQVTPEFTAVGGPMGNDRLPVSCLFRSCPQFRTKDCKPMGRLIFFLDGGRTDSVLELDTKSWNSIEGIQASMTQLGSTSGRVFELRVEIQQKATKKFPVLSITEADVDVNTDQDVKLADQLLRLAAALSTNDEGIIRSELAGTLELTNPGWRQNEKFIERIKAVGVTQAATGLLTKYKTDGAVAA